jgi:pyrimidine-specific ribonucleoside hydrolase
MIMKLTLTLSIFCSLILQIGTVAQTAKKPVPVIFDTDMGPDYDDVGALAMLHAFADNGEAQILATIASTKYEGVGPVLSVLNTYFERSTLPIGVPRGDASILRDTQHWSDSIIANYPHLIRSNDQTMDAVELYRKILAAQPDNSVTLITVGFLTNISNLLQSKADDYSVLSGIDLVNKKVNKLVSMAGRFPKGKEFNVQIDAKASRYVVANFKKPIILSGFEIGEKIKTGIPLINSTSIKDSPVKDVFRISIPLAKEDREGRMSWDETAVLVAVRGVEPFYKVSCGAMVVAPDGSNTWNPNGRGHCRLVESQAPATVQKLINELIMHQP